MTNNEEKYHKKVLIMYSQYCNTHDVNISYTNDVLLEALGTYLKNLLLRFTSITGNVDEDVIKDIDTYEKYKEAVKNVNSGNVLYDMIVLMFNYSNNIEEVPTALNNNIKTEYNDFLNETTTATFRKEGLSLKKSLESVPGAVQKYEVLYNNILSVYAALPTSCCVEQLFSFLKRANHTNSKIENVDTKISLILELRTEQSVVFAPK